MPAAVTYPVMERFPTFARGRGLDWACFVVHPVGRLRCGLRLVRRQGELAHGRSPKVDLNTLVQEAADSGLPRVVVTGGEPAMHDLGPLTKALREAGLATHLETSGAHPVSGDWDWVTLSPKSSSPAETNGTTWPMSSKLSWSTPTI